MIYRSRLTIVIGIVLLLAGFFVMSLSYNNNIIVNLGAIILVIGIILAIFGYAWKFVSKD